MAMVYRHAHAVAARMAGEHRVMDDAAGRVRRAAAASAGQRRETGEYSGNFKVATVTDRTKQVKDRLVYNDHPNAVAIELGHFAKKRDGTLGNFVPGQFNLLQGIQANRRGA